MTNAQIIWKYFKGKGFSDCGIAGLMGNLYAKSGLNSINLQNTYEKKLKMTDAGYTSAVDDGRYKNFVKDGAGYGLAQWTFWSRKQNLLQFCQSRGKSIGDLNTQLDFLYQELITSFSSLVKILISATSVTEASTAVLLQFERPSDQSFSMQQKRANYSQQYYNKFANISNVIEGGNKMKYSDSNKPLQCMMTNSTCYKQTRTMQVKGILWHSTGANNPNLKRYVQPSDNDPNYTSLINKLGKNTSKNDWNHISVQAGLNCWIGKLADGTVTTVQTMPWNYRPWGCGSGSKGSCNNGWIQFEICEDGLNDANYFNKIYEEACQITAYLCKMYNINPLGTTTLNGITVPTILCHADSHKLGLGSNHADVNHWFPKFGKSMETARTDVYNLMSNIQEDDEDMTDEKFAELMNTWLTNKANEKETWGTDNLEWAKANGIMAGGSAGRMMPNKFCTRLETVTMLRRLAEKLGLK